MLYIPEKFLLFFYEQVTHGSEVTRTKRCLVNPPLKPLSSDNTVNICLGAEDVGQLLECFPSTQDDLKKWGMVAHACNPTQEVETGGQKFKGQDPQLHSHISNLRTACVS